MGVMATFNPFAKVKNNKEEKVMTVELKEVQLFSKELQVLEDKTLGDFDNQKDVYSKNQQDVINQSKELVDGVKKDEQLMAQKINDLKNEEKALDRQQGEVAKALVEAEVSGDSNLVEKLDAQLSELGGKQVSLQAKIRAYTHRSKPLANIKERKKLVNLVNSYNEITFNSSEFDNTLNDLINLIKQLETFKVKLEEKIKLNPNNYRQDALTIINRNIGLDYIVASEKTKQLIGQEKRVTSKDISYFLEQWLRSNKEIGFDDFVLEEIESIKNWKEQQEEKAAQRKFEDQRAREERNAEALASVDQVTFRY